MKKVRAQMAQRIKALVAKVEGLSSDSQTNVVEGENQLPQSVL